MAKKKLRKRAGSVEDLLVKGILPKSLGERNTSPRQRRITIDARLQGRHIATIDLRILDLLQLTSTEEKENLLSAVYRELHPHDMTTQTLDILLGGVGPHDIDTFMEALMNTTKEKVESCSGSSSVTPWKREFRMEISEGKSRSMSPAKENAFGEAVSQRECKERVTEKNLELDSHHKGIDKRKHNVCLKATPREQGQELLHEMQTDIQRGQLRLSDNKNMELFLPVKIQQHEETSYRNAQPTFIIQAWVPAVQWASNRVLRLALYLPILLPLLCLTLEQASGHSS
ncbi:uncharacterized protein LOC120516401 [Polypterus senegalus]|uniref:uncharacterized protein LOC120516401 n=1 Tax=Polypterus senegalus TaxID=55291 RepID=UPI001963DEC6|nr:uncharacterized protein LOC120516401 [Polypterus senegalus]